MDEANEFTRQGAALLLGEMGERAVQKHLESRGFHVKYVGGQEMDLIVNHRVSVEVKTALPTAGSNGAGERWQFMLYKRGDGKPLDEDVLILRCLESIEAGAEVWHFVIPGYLRGMGRLTKIDITSRPDRYGGKWAMFLETWAVVTSIAAQAEKEGWPDPDPAKKRLPF